MKHLFAATLATFALLSTSNAAVSTKPPTMDQVAEATQAQGFAEVSKRKPKGPYYSSKRADAKAWKSIDAFPAGSLAKQVSVQCNQCKSRRMSEEMSVGCFEEVQKLATSLGVDLPGGVIRAFEGKEPEESWEVKDQAVKKLRYQKTDLKCDSRGGSGLRFDFFY